MENQSTNTSKTKNTQNSEKCSKMHENMHIFQIVAYMYASISIPHHTTAYMHTCMHIFWNTCMISCIYSISAWKARMLAYVHTSMQLCRKYAFKYAHIVTPSAFNALLNTSMQLFWITTYLYAIIQQACRSFLNVYLKSCLHVCNYQE